MSEFNRLEHTIGTILRAGVALSAVAMIAGLAMMATGHAIAPHLLNGGLILLMMIPTARILASLIDALIRRDALLAAATSIVTLVIAEEVIRKLFF
jgi:uncharacterized membrane protein